MTPHLAAVGLVVTDLARSFDCYRLLGLDLPSELPDGPHVEVSLPGGLRLMWDTVESIRSFDPGFVLTSGGASLAFDCGGATAVDTTFGALLTAGCTEVKKPWDAPWGQRYAQVEDPDGYPIDLFAALQ